MIPRPLHTRRGGLHHQIIRKAIHHQTRQQVRLTVHQAIEGLVEQPLAQAQGDLDAVYQQGFIQPKLGIPAMQPRTDQVVRAHCGQPHGLAGGVQQLHFLPGVKCGQWCLGDVDFIAEHPQVAALDTAVAVGLEAQAG